MTLGAFLDKVKRSSGWKADDYDWSKHNCQHFTATCMNILGARRSEAKSTDWQDLPQPLMDSLIWNEYQY